MHMEAWINSLVQYQESSAVWLLIACAHIPYGGSVVTGTTRPFLALAGDAIHQESGNETIVHT